MTISLLTDQQKYTVSTPVYEGPLDLLLQLIERAELDITKVSLVTVTTPFMKYVRTLNDYQAEQVSNFLIIAARLMQIKSEALLPRPIEREPGEEDPGDELIRQLIAYKRYKEIAGILTDRESYGLKSFPRKAPPPQFDAILDLSNIGSNDLHRAAQSLYIALQRAKPIDQVVRPPTVTIREKITHIISRLQKKEKQTFSKLLGKKASKVDIVVTFLAMLELVKQFRVNAYQEDLFSEIEIEVADELNKDMEYEIDFTE